MKLSTLLTYAIELHGVFGVVYECTYTIHREAIVYCKYNGELIGHCTFDGRKRPIYTEST